MDQELQVEPCWTTGNFVLGQETFEGGGGKVGKFSLVGLQNLTKCWRVTCWWTLGSHLSHTGLVALQVICVMIKVWQAATCSVCNFPYAQNFFFFGHLIRACGRQPWITLRFNCYADFILIICQCLWFDPNFKQINSWGNWCYSWNRTVSGDIRLTTRYNKQGSKFEVIVHQARSVQIHSS